MNTDVHEISAHSSGVAEQASRGPISVGQDARTGVNEVDESKPAEPEENGDLPGR